MHKIIINVELMIQFGVPVLIVISILSGEELKLFLIKCLKCQFVFVFLLLTLTSLNLRFVSLFTG